jgi:hypothetical protein
MLLPASAPNASIDLTAGHAIGERLLATDETVLRRSELEESVHGFQDAEGV